MSPDQSSDPATSQTEEECTCMRAANSDRSEHLREHLKKEAAWKHAIQFKNQQLAETKNTLAQLTLQTETEAEEYAELCRAFAELGTAHKADSEALGTALAKLEQAQDEHNILDEELTKARRAVGRETKLEQQVASYEVRIQELETTLADHGRDSLEMIRLAHEQRRQDKSALMSAQHNCSILTAQLKTEREISRRTLKSKIAELGKITADHERVSGLLSISEAQDDHVDIQQHADCVQFDY